MICVIALIVAGLLGIFSAKYRLIAKEAFNCVFKKLTLRKCDTGLDTRLKSEITAKFLKINPQLGRTIFRYFEVFSWILLILTLVTIFFVAQGVYFYAKYGNCNGPDSDQFCIFDPLGTNKPQNDTTPQICSIPGHGENKTLVAPPVDELISDSYKGSPDAKVVIIEFGCYSCHYTKLVEPTVKRLIDHYGDKILYVYRDFPLSLTHENALLASEASHCACDEGKYWEYREYLFANQPKQYYDDLISYAKDLGLDDKKFKECLDDEKYKDLVSENYQIGINSGITVTPTFFINNQTIIGAKDYKDFKKVIDKELGIKWWKFW
ncbi:TPA: thioredoxin domain-containing protein [Candidatus Woesearchaeota archaeon]|nr:DsbA family protein [Candidatus Woesearchaeota archaeon]HIH31284.1 thioredoxin domain-containing protein [Candidatus Woesearchaeota archaeon]HIH55573.1 thioredoxin domain-containing protein [Candidatus Woesearchaeota archaeon]HIJ02102.1 thioredoxin domain-containing protein [Candidatus Woesearchaeota archaeon]HIJ13666.1 thioredoxin domain-containing protein [Candidatus Woesearchaeota archaeon]